MTACDPCLRRGVLIAAMAPRITGLLGRSPRDRTSLLLGLSEEEMLGALAGQSREEIEATLERSRPADVRRQIAAADCEAVCVHSDLYPQRLAHLPDPPNPLYVRGGVERLSRLMRERGVAVVGGRKASEYGLDVARDMGRGLAAAGVTVISGLALGIDAASHRGALAGGGSALAVLACGRDVPYPRRHVGLYERIVEEGVVVSELAPGTPPYQWSFPARNRIMAALAHVVVVVEAREASGSLITAEFALSLNRELAAVPGHVTARLAAGSNRLLYEGMAVVRDARDVIEMLYGVGDERAQLPPEPVLEPPLRSVLDAVESGDSLQYARESAGLSAGGMRAAPGRLESLGLVRRDGLGGYQRSLDGQGRA